MQIIWYLFLSAAEGQSPRNYLSSCSWIYALSTSTTVLPRIFSLYLLPSLSLLPPPLSLSISHSLLPLSIPPSSFYVPIYLCTDQGGLVYFGNLIKILIVE